MRYDSIQNQRKNWNGRIILFHMCYYFAIFYSRDVINSRRVELVVIFSRLRRKFFWWHRNMSKWTDHAKIIPFILYMIFTDELWLKLSWAVTYTTWTWFPALKNWPTLGAWIWLTRAHFDLILHKNIFWKLFSWSTISFNIIWCVCD